MICNETNISKVSDVLVAQGAQVLVALSNDGWFRNSELIKKFHFMQARLRAVEQRKDFVINANCGYSGKISANGKIDIQEFSERLNVLKVKICLNRFNTIYKKKYNMITLFPHLLKLNLIFYMVVYLLI